MKEIQKTISSLQTMMHFNVDAIKLLRKLYFHHASQAKAHTKPCSKEYQSKLAEEIDRLLNP